MRKWVRVKGRLESITVSVPTTTIYDANETKQMTKRIICILQGPPNLPVLPCQPLRQILRLNPR